jgi:predicted phosphodiesterase
MLKPKLFLIVMVMMAMIFLMGCEKESVVSPTQHDPVIRSQSSGDGTLKIGVFSDPHYYDPSLGTSGPEFEMYMAYDRKMIPESHAIMQATVNEMLNENVDIVLVPGDMTKDGELHNHQKVVEFLAQLESAGKKVYVVPGNHDIDNPHAFAYPGTAVPIPTVSSVEFKSLYDDFGFGEALCSDPNSLTYIASPQDGVWILAMDACNYEGKFSDVSTTGGKFSAATMNWIVSKLQQAQAEGITVIGMMHHGVVEHFPGMEQIFAEYLVLDWQNVADTFVANGLKVVFTGHHHATDISSQGFGRTKIFDIQTGSLVTWQCPYRVIRYDLLPNVMNIDNKVITSISGIPDFQPYAYYFLASGMPLLVVHQLMQLGLDEPTATALEPLVTATMLAYYHGDEPTMRNEDIIAGIYQLLQHPDPAAQNLGQLLLGIWTDRTEDSDVIINLRNGQIFTQGIS